jgi:hypothetical protein
MLVELNDQDFDTIRTSLEYSKERIRNVSETPANVRTEQINRIDDVLGKLRKTVR